MFSILKCLIFQGCQVIDVSRTYLGFPYTIDFCNLTQVRNDSGYKRNIRRINQAPYPLVKIQSDEVIQFNGLFLCHMSYK